MSPIFGDAPGMLQFIAYGEEANFVHPPKPRDPKQPWNPEWSVKVRLKSTGMSPLTESPEGMEMERETRRSDDDGDGDTRRGRGRDSGSSGSTMERLKGLFDW